jgi:hypothetical protein
MNHPAGKKAFACIGIPGAAAGVGAGVGTDAGAAAVTGGKTANAIKGSWFDRKGTNQVPIF